MNTAIEVARGKFSVIAAKVVQPSLKIDNEYEAALFHLYKECLTSSAL